MWSLVRRAIEQMGKEKGEERRIRRIRLHPPARTLML